MIHFFIFLVLPIIAYAEVPAWKIIPNESTLTFTATQNGAPVTGKFTDFSGDIHFDPAQLNASHININIEINTSTDAAIRKFDVANLTSN